MAVFRWNPIGSFSDMNETPSILPLNRKASIALILSIFALLAFCVGFLPIPFTVLVCYPPGILMSIAALILGIQSLREIRKNGERGRAMATISTWIGGLLILASVCVITTGILVWPYVSEFVKQTWTQLTH